MGVENLSGNSWCYNVLQIPVYIGYRSVTNKNNSVYDYWIEIPEIDEALYPLIEIIPIQLLAYFAALEKDTDPDYPRNLAKSVTVK